MADKIIVNSKEFKKQYLKFLILKQFIYITLLILNKLLRI